MPTRPTALISDEMIQSLESTCLWKATFQDISGVQYPWEITQNTLSFIRHQLEVCETELRSRFPFQVMVCMATGDALYWIDENKFDTISEQMQKVVNDLKEAGPLPIWKCTTAELLTNHLKNIKRLILTIVHDSILLKNLKQVLGDRYKLVSREFHLAERAIFKLIHLLYEYGPKIAYVMNQDLILLERCTITQSMLERGEATPEDLGYSEEQLNQVIEKLNNRCIQTLPGAIVMFRTIHNYSKNALRDGESSQLLRASRWEILLSLMDEIPKEIASFHQLVTLERSGMSAFVNSRERELGTSSSGKEALTKAQEAKENVEAKETADSDKNTVEVEFEETAAPKEVQEERSARPAKRVSRMVTRKRRSHE